MLPVKYLPFILFFIIIYSSSACLAQKSNDHQPDFEKNAVIPKKQKQYKYIIVVDTRNILYGNKCATMATHRLGFEYLPIPKSQLVTERESSIMFHNLFTRLGITLRRGIFWRLALNHRIKECQRKSRDMNDY